MACRVVKISEDITAICTSKNGLKNGPKYQNAPNGGYWTVTLGGNNEN